MPWKEWSVMDERLRFVGRLLDGEAMTEVYREFGISRKTGYKIFDRYKEHGLEALTDRSRRPVRYANQLPAQIEGVIVSLKRALRPLPVEPSEEKCHNNRACGRTHPCRSEAYPGVLEPRIPENPLTDPALRPFSRFRRDRARGGIRIATLPVPRRGTAGSYRGHRLHHLVCRNRACRACRFIVLGLLRLLLYGAAHAGIHHHAINYFYFGWQRPSSNFQRWTPVAYDQFNRCRHFHLKS
jgi:hypothetical protein